MQQVAALIRDKVRSAGGRTGAKRCRDPGHRGAGTARPGRCGHAGPCRLRPGTRRRAARHRFHLAGRVLAHRAGRAAGHRLRFVARAAPGCRPRHVRSGHGLRLAGLRRAARRPRRAPRAGHRAALLRPEDLRRRPGAPHAGDRRRGPHRGRPGAGLLGRPRRRGAAASGHAAGRGHGRCPAHPARSGRHRRRRPGHRTGPDPVPGAGRPAAGPGAAGRRRRSPGRRPPPTWWRWWPETNAHPAPTWPNCWRPSAPPAGATRQPGAGARRRGGWRRSRAQEGAAVVPSRSAAPVGAAETAGHIVALAFPERVARRVNGGAGQTYLLASGTRAGLPRAARWPATSGWRWPKCPGRRAAMPPGPAR